MSAPVPSLVSEGLWRNNAALVQLLGICPLLAITTSLVNGLALGLATTAVIVASNFTVSLTRRWLLPAVRILVFVLIIASLVTVVDLLSNAYFHELHETLGLFIPLIVTNCAILAQAEVVASKRPVGQSMLAGLSTGLGFAAVLAVLGTIREIIGTGRLFSSLDLLLGGTSVPDPLNLPFDGMLVMILPPGAFFALAALVALKNHLDARHRAPQAEKAPERAADSSTA
jgi:electron transport complex protein RnfE